MRKEPTQDVSDSFIGGKLKTLVAIGWFLVCTAFGGGVWATSLSGRISNLERWQQERQKPIEDYYEFKVKLESRLTQLETTQSAMLTELRLLRQAVERGKK